jgi:ring-1,2-phenylacetyl-CoA epoxidase subunit PaaC
VSAYDEALLDDESAQWAFGTGFADPLAGLDPTVPDHVDRAELAATCLRLGDDALVLSQRLAEWCSNAPELEEDVALANIALDLLGQARLLLTRAAVADPALVPSLPAGSPVPAEDALAFFRDADAFRNDPLCELPNGDFGRTVARLLLCSAARLDELDRLRAHPDPVLAAIAAKAVPELTYHRDHAARWVVILARGTDESRARVAAGLAEVWPWYDGAVGETGSEMGGEMGGEAVDQVLAAAGLPRPEPVPRPAVRHLDELLAELQSVARAHPQGRW